MSDNEEEYQQQDLRPQVRIGIGSVFGSNNKFVMAYRPETDADGNVYTDQNDILTRVVKLGGVKVGAEGRIVGPPLKTPRSFLGEGEKLAGTFGVDLVELIPVDLTEYKQLAWFPSHHVRVVG
jgi:hypothetical protein